MTLQKILTSAIACLLICFAIPTKASHIMGADFEYTCIGGDTFEVTLNVYSHCDGIGLPNAQTVQFTSSCGQTFSTSLAIVWDSLNLGYTEVSTFCDSMSVTCTTVGSPNIGIRHHQYTGIVVLSPPCPTWTMTWSTCCRSNTVNVPTSTGDQLLVDAELDNSNYGCNSSPQWNNHLAYIVCASDTSYLDFSVTDPEGDSVSYAFVPAWDLLGYPVVYGAGFSATQPIPTAVLDSTTGIVCISAGVVGNYIVAVEVTQYDSLGNIISTIRRDIQVTVSNCGTGSSSQTPYNVGGFSNLVGSVSLAGPMNLSTCAGENICFDFVVNDDDILDTLELTTDLQTYLPGATVTLSGANPLTVNVCWTAQPSASGIWQFPLHVMDDHCPITQSNTWFGTIDLQGGIFVSGQSTSCAGNPVQLTVQGSSGGYNWTSISGDPINVGVNFSCDTCATVVASPSVTTTYVVTGGAAGTCPNIDTITVVVDPGFSVTVTDSIHALGCNDDSITIQLTPAPAGSYMYDWSGPGLTSNGLSSNTVIVTSSGQVSVIYTVTSAVGCVQSDTLNFTVNVSDAVLWGDTVVCPYDSVQLNIGNPQGVLYADWYDCNTDSLIMQNSYYVWQSPVTSNCFYAVYTDPVNNCIDTLYQNITFLPSPVTGTVVGPTNAEVGDTITYYIAGGLGTSWNWGVYGGNIYSGFGTDTIQVIWTTAGSGTIWVIAQDLSTTCSGLIEYYNVTVDEPPIGVAEQQISHEFTLAPNPAGNLVTVFRDGDAEATIIITDISGKQLQAVQSNTNSEVLDISSLASGLYFVTLQNTDGRHSNTLKLLIER